MPKSSIKSKKPSWKKAALAIGAIGIIAGSVPVVKRVIDPGELVTEVIDGDTFTISNNQNIRLYGVDAPEIGNCFGTDAKEALSEKILNKNIVLKNLKTDYYKRIQAYVFVDGEFVNEYMAKNGFVLNNSNRTDLSDIVKDANNFARDNKIGIFSEKCSPTFPTQKGCVIKGQLSYNMGQSIYVLPGCRDYTQTKVERFRGEDWFCSEKEAKAAGFTKSPNCP